MQIGFHKLSNHVSCGPGEFKTDPNKSINLQSLKKIMIELGEDLLRAFYKLFRLRFCVSSNK